MKRRLLLVLLMLNVRAHALEHSFKGQAALWGMTHGFRFEQGQVGVRYLPEMTVRRPGSPAVAVEVSANVNAVGTTQPSGGDVSARLYRAALRVAGDRWEMGAGLQKIAFGSALLLRPLMWFDSLDPRDPMHLTDGVTGLTGRYVFQDNTNIQIWALMGKNERRGFELTPSAQGSGEFGGRLQRPVPRGELALSVHRRKLGPSAAPRIAENRFAADGKWDLGFGLWFEAALIRPEKTFALIGEQRLLSVGVDYTFGIGNGLHLSAERLTSSAEFSTTVSRGRFFAVQADYPLSIWDQLFALLFIDEVSSDLFQFYSWQRSYDRALFRISVFGVPRQAALPFTGSEGARAFLGNGVQLMIILNH